MTTNLKKGSSLFSVEWRTQFGTVSRVSANPKGIESISPGLRGMSYPGGMTEKSQTLQAEIFKLKIIGHLPAVPIGATHLKRKSSLKL